MKLKQLFFALALITCGSQVMAMDRGINPETHPEHYLASKPCSQYAISKPTDITIRRFSGTEMTAVEFFRSSETTETEMVEIAVTPAAIKRLVARSNAIRGNVHIYCAGECDLLQKKMAEKPGVYAAISSRLITAMMQNLATVSVDDRTARGVKEAAAIVVKAARNA